jgi:uncharacterized protein YdbL (DUF1318 family)
MPKNDSTEAETYRKMFLGVVEENAELKKQIAQEVKEKYAAYRRIAELTGSSAEAIKENME